MLIVIWLISVIGGTGIDMNTFKLICLAHNNVMLWKCFLYCWPLLKGVHWFPVDSHNKRPLMRIFMISLLLSGASYCTNSQVFGNLRHRDTAVMSFGFVRCTTHYTLKVMTQWSFWVSDQPLTDDFTLGHVVSHRLGLYPEWSPWGNPKRYGWNRLVSKHNQAKLCAYFLGCSAKHQGPDSI